MTNHGALNTLNIEEAARFLSEILSDACDGYGPTVEEMLAWLNEESEEDGIVYGGRYVAVF